MPQVILLKRVTVLGLWMPFEGATYLSINIKRQNVDNFCLLASLRALINYDRSPRASTCKLHIVTNIQLLVPRVECLRPKQAGCSPHWPRISWLWQKEEEVVGLYLLRSSSAGERLGSYQTCTVGNGCFAPRFKSGYTSPFWWSFWPFLNEVMSCRALATLFFIVDGGRNVPSQFLPRPHPRLIPQWREPV